MASADALWSVAVMMLAGVTFGAWTSLYAAKRAAWRWRSAFSVVADWAWFVVVSVLLIVALFFADWGQLRAWALVAAGAGFGLWMGLAHPLCFAGALAVFKAERRGWRAVGRGFRWFVRAALAPAWAWPRRWVFKPRRR